MQNAIMIIDFLKQAFGEHALQSIILAYLGVEAVYVTDALCLRVTPNTLRTTLLRFQLKAAIVGVVVAFKDKHTCTPFLAAALLGIAWEPTARMATALIRRAFLTAARVSRDVVTWVPRIIYIILKESDNTRQREAMKDLLNSPLPSRQRC